MSNHSLGEFDDEEFLLQMFVRDASCFDLPTMQNALPIDLVLNERYRVIAPLSSGGMADVYIVIDESYRSPPKRALKITKAPSSELESRFRNEYESQVQLRHDNIVPIYDIGNYRGRSWMVLDLVHGVSWDVLHGQPLPPSESGPNTAVFLTLEQLLRYLELSDFRITDSLAAELIEVCADAISTVHATGFVHRDLKPANIFLDIRTTGGINRLLPRIGDFGLVKRHIAEETSVPTRKALPDAVHPKFIGRLPVRRRLSLSRWSLDRRCVKKLSSSGVFGTVQKRQRTAAEQPVRRHAAPAVWPNVLSNPRQEMAERHSWRPSPANQAEQETARTILTTAVAGSNTWNIPPGTRSYMSPERWSGITNPSNDVWALGVVLYQLLTGHLPYKVSDDDIHRAEEIRNHALRTGQPPAEADAQAACEIAKRFHSEVVKPHLFSKSKLRGTTDRDLSEICCKCLKSNPVDRYQSANELCVDLRRYLTHRVVTAYRAPISHRMSLWRRRRPTLATALLLSLLTALLLVAGGAKYLADSAHYRAKGLAERLLDAEISEIPAIVRLAADSSHRVVPQLREAWNDSALGARQKQNVSLALIALSGDDDAGELREHLYKVLLNARPNEVPVICEIMKPHSAHFKEALWKIVSSATVEHANQRLYAAAALAAFDSSTDRWKEVQEAIACDLVAVPPVFSSYWMEALRPIRQYLIPELTSLYGRSSRSEAERALTTDIVVEYASDQPEVMSQLVMDGNDRQFLKAFPKLAELGDAASRVLHSEIDLAPFPTDLPSSAPEREIRAKRQANAAVALLRLNQPDKVWKLLAFHPRLDDFNSRDPRLRSYLIHRFALLGADSASLIRQLDCETDVTIKRALVLSLGRI